MADPPVLIAMGPCLFMGMAAVALLVVHARLSPVRHARYWAGAFAASAAQWALMALNGWRGQPPFHGGLLADLLGGLAVLLFAEGFRLRAGIGSPWLMRGTALVLAALLIGTKLLPPMPLRAAISPLVCAAALGWAATLVAPRATRVAVAEVAVIGMLVLLALIDVAAAGMAVAEQAGLLPGHSFYTLIYIATIEPACAALALFTLLLIAFDFSVELRRLTHTDPLTGVLNRLGFEHAARGAFRWHRRGRPLALAIADIDAFKLINDRHGHAAGDAVLACFAGHLSGALGRGEHVARIGGEEFALLLPDHDGSAALGRIDPLRAGLGQLVIAAHPTVTMTASFGIAECRRGEPLEHLVERADQALYQAKRAGRNRATLADLPAA
jgi:diguanylate cyclase (GGDEF)-like protein